MAGPFCAQLLGDLGAEVIKIEPMKVGDATRVSMGAVLPGGESSAFLAVNRNKRSISVNLKSDAGREIALRLAETADVVLENFRPGVVRRLGIDYESVRKRNPRIIYCSISGFGQTGPYSQRPGYDLIAQAMSGIMSVTGEEEGDPVKCGVPVADLSAGLFAAIGILSVCVGREASGEGQYIDVSLLDSALALSVWECAQYWSTGGVPERMGSAHRMSAPYQKFRTNDGELVIGANNESVWRRLCAALGRPDLCNDARFSTNEDRMRNRAALTGEIETVLTTRSTDECMALLLDAGVPAGPIRNYAQVLEDGNTRTRQMVMEYEHPREGLVKTLGVPVKMSSSPAVVRLPAPLLGEHTDEILRDIGYPPTVIKSLRAEGVVQ
jgi:formyl-CoA transferase